VEAQQKSSGSLLHWTKRMIDIRKRHPVFGLGEYVPLEGDNPGVLAFARRLDAPGEPEDLVICVNNLSRFPQAVQLRVPAPPGSVLRELTGGVTFPPATADFYRLTLSGHGFFWFSVLPPGDLVEEGR
ncbi:alpha-glucosidase C-terminal domain-containing protein, partial [Streptosporangium sp. NPDC001559]|uniref:alpha-glucosidase C-terminal domain-containing protein n=1 Tax=Streptosporangium sp. NPDC001559 TaxID=3366187 RepID=UPI0036E87FEE